MTIHDRPSGLWLPLVTPFIENELDETSLRRLVKYYGRKGLGGIVLAATTGEGQTLSDKELEQLVAISADEISHCGYHLPAYLGISGVDPVQVCKQLERTSSWPIEGYLISGPGYLRPSQQGLKQSYELFACSTKRSLLIYNIPYRTGVNIHNETMLELACIPNIVGVKDCCGDPEQSYELLRQGLKNFSVLTGEAPLFYNALVHGAPGAIVTGAHVMVDAHLQIMSELEHGLFNTALELWNQVAHIPRLLFAEPSPAPVKYWLWKTGLIESPEVRLPFLPIGKNLSAEIEKCIADSQYHFEL